MKNTKLLRSLIIAFIFAFSSTLLHAQHLHGIRIHAGNHRVLVYMDGRQISLPTTSCFIANLHQGRYAIEVYEAGSHHHGSHMRGRLLYRESVRYKGHGIKDIVVNGRVDDRFPPYSPSSPSCPDRYDPLHVMSSEVFEDFYKTLKHETFLNARLKMLGRTIINTRFTCAQCKRILHLCDFDSERLKYMKMLYPVVVDKQNFYMVMKKLSFNASKNEMERFIKDYHLRHRR